MNKPLKISALLLILCIAACKAIAPTAEVSYLSSENGILSLRSTGYGKTKEECLLNAQKNAFETLFFRGIPASQQNQPLIGIDEKEKLNKKNYFNDFYEKERYKSFMTSSQPVSGVEKIKGGKKLTVDVGINLPTLRKDLENNSIIRKFGY